MPCLCTRLLSTVQTLWPCNDLRGQRCYLQSVSQRLAQSIYWLNILLLLKVQTKDPDGKVDFFFIKKYNINIYYSLFQHKKHFSLLAQYGWSKKENNNNGSCRVYFCSSWSKNSDRLLNQAEHIRTVVSPKCLLLNFNLVLTANFI